MKYFQRACIIIPIIVATLALLACEKRLPGPELSSPATQRIATPEDKQIVVAKVNEVTITMHSLIGVMNRIISNPGTATVESTDKIREKALDRLILEEVVFQEARRQALRVEQSDIDKAVANLRKNAGGEQQFQNFLTKELLTDAELRVQIERILLIDAVFNREVRKKKVSLTEDELRKEYEREKDRYRIPEILTAVDIMFFLKLEDPASIEKAAAILAKLNADKDRDPANLASDDTFIVRNLDFQQEKNKEPMLYNAARKLKAGEFSPVIMTRDSIHILKLTNFSPESWKPYDEVKGLVEIRLKIATQKKHRDEWERALIQRAKIEIMDAPMRGF